jgi:hypothetical protein
MSLSAMRAAAQRKRAAFMRADSTRRAMLRYARRYA